MKLVLIMRLQHSTRLTISSKNLMMMTHLQLHGGFLKTQATGAILNTPLHLRKVPALASLDLGSKSFFDQETFSCAALSLMLTQKKIKELTLSKLFKKTQLLYFMVKFCILLALLTELIITILTVKKQLNQKAKDTLLVIFLVRQAFKGSIEVDSKVQKSYELTRYTLPICNDKLFQNWKQATLCQQRSQLALTRDKLDCSEPSGDERNEMNDSKPQGSD